MIRTFLGAASALALMAGVAAAQNAPTDTTPKPSTTEQTGQATQPPMQNQETAAPGAAGTAETPTGADMSAGSTEKPAAGPDTAADSSEKPMGADTATDSSETPAGADTAAGMDEQTPASTDTAAGSPETPAAGASDATTEVAAGPPISGRDLMGRNVMGADGESVGEVYDVIIDSANGRIEQVIIASGGFLGLGEKTVAVDYDQLEVEPGMGIAAKSLTREGVKSMAEYDVSDATRSLDAEQPAPAAGGAPTAMPPAGGAPQQ